MWKSYITPSAVFCPSTVWRALQRAVAAALIIGVPFKHRLHGETQGQGGRSVDDACVLCFSHSGTIFGNVFTRLHPTFAEKEDNFDWGKYLMEGEDIDTGPYPDTPVSQNPLCIHMNKQNRISYCSEAMNLNLNLKDVCCNFGRLF